MNFEITSFHFNLYRQFETLVTTHNFCFLGLINYQRATLLYLKRKNLVLKIIYSHSNKYLEIDFYTLDDEFNFNNEISYKFKMLLELLLERGIIKDLNEYNNIMPLKIGLDESAKKIILYIEKFI
jgi:hypothetical protein